MHFVKFTNRTLYFSKLFLLSIFWPLYYTIIFVIVLFKLSAYTWSIWNYPMCFTYPFTVIYTKMDYLRTWSIIYLFIGNIVLRIFIRKTQITLDMNHIIWFTRKKVDALSSIFYISM